MIDTMPDNFWDFCIQLIDATIWLLVKEYKIAIQSISMEFSEWIVQIWQNYFCPSRVCHLLLAIHILDINTYRSKLLPL